tara:strand:+ start:17651 stop:18316 length:666 start_codon:yes stop_codon:yes gene_type:complete
MPSWKKIITSGSDAALNSVTKTGDFTLDVSGNITLDADGAQIRLEDNGTEFGRLSRVASDLVIKSISNNNDILLKGVDNSSTITALKLDMSEAGNAQFNAKISGSEIEASGDVIAYGTSDERLKDNMVYIGKPLEKIDKIGGYTFDWNEKQQTFRGKDIGVKAQEIEAVLPEIVTTRASGYKGVKYEKIVPLLIEGIKALNQKVEHLENLLGKKIAPKENS